MSISLVLKRTIPLQYVFISLRKLNQPITDKMVVVYLIV